MASLEYRQHLVATALILSELGDRPIAGSELLKRVRSRGEAALRSGVRFSFVDWAGLTFWEAVDALSESNLLDSSARQRNDAPGWERASFSLTGRGRSYLSEVMESCGELMAPFLGSVRHRRVA